MKVNPVTTPIDALVPQRSSGSEASTSSFPETLREARAGVDGSRAREESERSDRDERKGAADRSERTQRDERAEGARESEPETTENDETATEVAEGEDAATAEAETAVETEATPVAGPTSFAAIANLSTAVATPTAGAAGSTAGAELPTTPVAGMLSSALPTQAAPSPLEAPVVAGTETTPKGAVTATATEPGATDPKTLAPSTPQETIASGTKPAEGELAALAPRGELKSTQTAGTKLATGDPATASAPGATAETNWFRPGEGKAEGADRASFHLLDGGTAGDAEARSEISIPRTAAVTGEGRATNATSQTRVEGGSLEPVAPTATASGSAALNTGSTAATRATAEVISADLAEPRTFARRIFRQVRMSLARGDQELNIRLDPPRLGRVDVDLKVDAEKIGIRFVVETEEVRDALRAHIDDLHRSLESHGMRSETVEIDLREGSSEGESSSSRSNGSEDGSNPDENGENSLEHRELRLWHLGKTVDLKG